MTDETLNQSNLPRRQFSGWYARAAVALAVVIATGSPVHAEVRVNGDAGAVQVDAAQSNVAEVLAALESTFRLRVNSSVLLDRAVSGTYTGALPELLSRLLRGYNYVIRRQATEIEVTIIGLQDDHTAARTRMPPGNPALSLADAVRLKIH
jgi:hypothetical protein